MPVTFRCHGCAGRCLGAHIVITICRVGHQLVRRHFCCTHCLQGWLPPLP
jgi:hypothetical protein